MPSRAGIIVRLFLFKHKILLNWLFMIFAICAMWLLISQLESVWQARDQTVKEAALAGDRHAQTLAGLDSLAHGANYREARIWFAMAAAKGDGAAQYNLALLLYEGRGGEKDVNAALRWFGTAASNGYAPAAAVLQALKSPENYSDALRGKLIETKLNEIRDSLHMLAQ